MAPVSKYQLTINSPNVRYTEDYIESDYIYESVKCVKDEETKTITVSSKSYCLQLDITLVICFIFTCSFDRRVPSQLPSLLEPSEKFQKPASCSSDGVATTVPQ